MGKTIIERAAAIVQKAAYKYNAANDIYYIEQGKDEDRMNEHPAMCDYCEKCIDEAVLAAKEKYYEERRVEMGKIFEYEQRGFYTQTIYKYDKDNNPIKLVLKKVRDRKNPKEKVVKWLKQKLRKDYPANMLFSYRYYSCGETDDFDLCESCGIIFNQGLLLSSQEMEHWESVKDKDLKRYVKDPYHAYQLDKILYEYSPAYGKHNDRILALAKRIINLNS